MELILFRECFFCFMVREGHIDKVVDFFFFFLGQGFDVFHVFEQPLIHPHVIAGQQVIHRYIKFTGKPCRHFDGGLDLAAFIAPDDGSRGAYLLGQVLG